MSTARASGAPHSYLASSMAAGEVTGVLVGSIFHVTGRIAGFAAMYGVGGVFLGWFIHLVHSTLAGALFGPLLRGRLPGVGAVQPSVGPTVTGATLGIIFAVGLWAGAVASVLPLWMDAIFAVERPFPYIHLASLWALIGFGVDLGGLVGVLER